MALTKISIGASSRIAEDILGGTSPLKRRGRLIYSGDPIQGFPGVGQHSTGLTFRPPPSVSRFPGGLKYMGHGAAAASGGVADQGLGSADSGSGFYLRLDRLQQDVYYTVSGRFALVSEQPGAIDKFHVYYDTQNADDTDRSYSGVGWFADTTLGAGVDTGKWKLRGDATSGSGYTTHPYIDTGLTRFPGDNENKFDSTYFAFSFFHASTMSNSHYGHFQIAGEIADLRSLGGGYAKHAVQAGNVPFRNGLNVGMSFVNTLVDRSGGFILERLEVTVGDTLT